LLRAHDVLDLLDGGGSLRSGRRRRTAMRTK
jgi:hypothetical protein